MAGFAGRGVGAGGENGGDPRHLGPTHHGAQGPPGGAGARLSEPQFPRQECERTQASRVEAGQGAGGVTQPQVKPWALPPLPRNRERQEAASPPPLAQTPGFSGVWEGAGAGLGARMPGFIWGGDKWD